MGGGSWIMLGFYMVLELRWRLGLMLVGSSACLRLVMGCFEFKRFGVWLTENFHQEHKPMRPTSLQRWAEFWERVL